MLSSSVNPWVVALGMLAALGCSSGDDGAPGDDTRSCSGKSVSLAADVLPITTPSCSGGQICHHAMGSAQGVYDFVVNKPATECRDGRLIGAPGDPTHSYLIDKLTNQNL